MSKDNGRVRATLLFAGLLAADFVLWSCGGQGSPGGLREVSPSQERHLETLGVSAAAFHGEGLVSGGFDGRLLFHSAAGQPDGPPTAEHEGPVEAVAELPGGGLVTASGGILRWFDGGGTLRWKSSGLSAGRFRTLSAEPECERGPCLIAGDDRGVVFRIRGTEAPAEVVARGLAGGVGAAVALGPNAVVGLDSGVVLQLHGSGVGASRQAGAAVTALAAFPKEGGSHLVAAGTASGRLMLFEAQAGDAGPIEPEARLRVLTEATALAEEVTRLAFSRDGTRLLVGGSRGELASFLLKSRPVSVERESRRGVDFVGHQGRILALRERDDGWTSFARDAHVRFWRSDGRPVRPPYLGHRDSVSALAFVDEHHIVTAGGSKALEIAARFWHRSGEPLGPPLELGKLPAIALAAQDGERVAVATADGALHFLNLAKSGPEEKRIPEVGPRRLLGAPAHVLAFTATGRLIAGDARGRLLFVEPDGGGPTRTLAGHKRRVSALALGPEGRLASGAWDRSIRLARLGTTPIPAANATRLVDHRAFVSALAFSHDGKHLASGSWDNEVVIRAPDTGARLATCRGHEDWVRALRFHPSGRYLLSVADDRRLLVWDLNCRPIAEARLHRDIILALDISPSGDFVATGGRDGRVYVHEFAKLLRNPSTVAHAKQAQP